MGAAGHRRNAVVSLLHGESGSACADQNLAIELGGSGIRVNAVSPAVVHTPIYEGFIPKEDVKDVMNSFDGFHPIGRVGTPDDIAQTVVFCSAIAPAG